ncbi:hypothetical protein ISN44_As06g046360 [Arabidopsis suecica]|uniref:DUF1677 family protein n=1 Tax=Arabidopsis suecica TaxID=45249 RepID=A0A8T2CQF9_ARASU|nr:hypothetical protein ISN44_As06g046360 [Arabidopsis suecica]
MTVNLMVITESKTSEIEFARCECCRMQEEYTAAYIESVRCLYAGKFICGLCSEAVKYEIFRWGKKKRGISVDEALAIHMKFCGEFIASPSPTVDFISVVGEIFRRRLILNLPSVVTSAELLPPTVDGGEVCATAAIGGAGTGSCLPALSGGV